MSIQSKVAANLKLQMSDMYAARLEKKGIKVSTIYGSLPPQIRKKQFEMFLSGETEVVVATDAIGLGVNLPIRRIVFMNIYKFDGMSTRLLNEYEIRQIAGRAGRKGLYEQGYVMSHQINYVRIGFPSTLLVCTASFQGVWEK